MFLQMLFEYNWQVREDWFHWCEQVEEEVLMAKREGGLGSILENLFHIVDIEQAWMRGLQGVPEFHYSYEDYPSLAAIRELSDQCRPDVERIVQNWSEETDQKTLFQFTYAEVVRHVIAHEIHHIGQLSVWSREIGREPVNPNLILRGLTLSSVE